MIQAVLHRMSRSKPLRRSLGRPYLRLTEWIWNRIPASMGSWRLVHSYGRHCQRLALLREARRMSIGTYFLRNRPELECLCRLLQPHPAGSRVGIMILACSKGAEVYSMSFAVRSARPDLHITFHALDIEPEVVEIAARGLYSLKDMGQMTWPDRSLIAEKGELAWDTWRGQDTSVFERMSAAEITAMFDQDGDQVRVKPQFREDINWGVGDAGDPQLARNPGPQDVVVANRFLCHLPPAEATRCLRNIGRLVKPGGYLFVSGVDLDVRTRVARELGWKPVTDLLKEMHEGDPSLRLVWPWNYCGLEPLDANRPDWKVRYASAFQIGDASSQGKP